MKDRCIEVYGASKVAEDFTVSDHAVAITMHGSGLKIDVVPVLYEGEPDDRGYLVTRQDSRATRQGDRVLTSVTLHLSFMTMRRTAAGANYRELIRLLKAWIWEAKRNDDQLVAYALARLAGLDTSTCTVSYIATCTHDDISFVRGRHH